MSKLKTLKGALQALQEAMWGNKESRALVPLSNADEGTAILSPDGKETFDLGRRDFLRNSTARAASPLLRTTLPRGALSTLARQIAEEDSTDVAIDKLVRSWNAKYGKEFMGLSKYAREQHVPWADKEKAFWDLGQRYANDAGVQMSKVNEIFGQTHPRSNPSIVPLMHVFERANMDHRSLQRLLQSTRDGKLRVRHGDGAPWEEVTPAELRIRRTAKDEGAEDVILDPGTMPQLYGTVLTPLQRMKLLEGLFPGVHTDVARTGNRTVDLLMDHTADKRKWAQLLLEGDDNPPRLGLTDLYRYAHDFEPSHYARKRLLDALK